MGDPRRKHKKYQRPKKRFNTTRIKEEDSLLKEYGLKSKKELWKAEFRIDKIRKQAQKFIDKPHEQEKFLNKLKAQGFKVNAIDDALALKKEDLLERRLQTILLRKKLANTIKHARQLITHKHVAINDAIVNIPSFNVSRDAENKIKVIKSKQKAKKSEVQDAENKEKESV